MRGTEPDCHRRPAKAPVLTGDPHADAALLTLARLLADIAANSTRRPADGNEPGLHAVSRGPKGRKSAGGAEE